MNRSGITRGLAVTAVSALAVSGLALAGPAMAQDVGEAQVPGFELYSGVTVDGVSTRNDGVNQTVTLFAARADGQDINSVLFTYDTTLQPTPVTIADVAVDENGIAQFEWTPPAGAAGAAITGVTATALDADDNIEGVQSFSITPGTIPTNQAVNLGGGDLGRLGLSPYSGNPAVEHLAVVRGTTTGTQANTDVQNVGPAAIGAISDVDQIGDPDGSGVRQFAEVMTVPNTNLDLGDGEDDQIVVRATAGPNGSDSDDVNAYTTYVQEVTNVTAPNDPAFPANIQEGAPLDDTKYDITVVDQEGDPIVGVPVFEVENTAANAGPDASGPGVEASGATDLDGQFTVTINEATLDGPEDTNLADNVQSAYYVVDVDQNGVYTDGVDFRFQLDQTATTPITTQVTLESELGTVLDDDEETDVVATVRDQNGQPIANKSVVFSGTVTDEDSNPVTTINLPQTPLTTNAQGQVVLPNIGDFAGSFEDGPYEVVINAFVNNNGTPVQDAGDVPATPIRLSFDRTTVVWESEPTAQAQNGTTTVQYGSLVQVNKGGTLTGAPRQITVFYTPTGNSQLAPQAQQPAGTVRGSATAASAQTQADGRFGVAVQDPATPNGQELGNQLFADSLPLESASDSTDSILTVDFLRSLTPDRIRILNDINGTEADGLRSLLDPNGNLIPGGAGVGEVEVTNADGVPLTNFEVDLTIDEGNFVPFDPDAGTFELEPTPAVGAPVDLASAGQSITVTTDGDGQAIFIANIERNEGFDDDGEVDDEINASAGSRSDTHDLTWTTIATPLNPRATDPLVVELSEDQESTILPQARAGNPAGSGQVVTYDVETYDQFGNRTQQDTTTTDNTPLADFDGGTESEFDLTQPAITAFASQATSQVLDVELDGATTFTYTDDASDSTFDPNNPQANFDVDPVQEEVSTDAISWYDLDVANSTFTLTQEGAQTVPVGTTVTMVFTARDQNGQPIQGMFVDFLRAGPSNDDQDSCIEDGLNNCIQTDANGQAFLDFAGGSAGTANVSVVGYEDDGTRIGTLATDTVVFGSAPPPVNPRSPINPALKGKSSGNKDVLTVRAKKADGAKVTLFRIVNNRRVRVASGTLNANGVKRFAVRDTNGNRLSSYQAVVAPTSDTKRGTTQRRQLR